MPDSASVGPHLEHSLVTRSKKFAKGGMHASTLYFSSIVSSSRAAQGGERSRIGEHLQRGLGQPFDVEKRLDQAILARLDHLAHRRHIRRQHHAAGRHRVQQRPRQHKRRGQVDVQVADPQDVGQLLGQDPSEKEEPAQVITILAQAPIA